MEGYILDPKIKFACVVHFLLKLVALCHQEFVIPIFQRGCFLMDAQVPLWSNHLQSRYLQDFPCGSWSCRVQFAMIVLFDFVTIFLSIPLYQQVGRKGGMMNAFWIGLVVGQARNRWSTILLVRRIFSVHFRRK